ncbi:MAG: type IV toxin-antitoxin system AbiEi family antitoxin domain-containing protein [Myxococcaceae bacterium]|nr:type IV toxin-antitoxin system AbiEi family antitoxin domain-containing protein [Myxococcaceae bacterium]
MHNFDKVAELASKQHGVVSRRQMMALGVPTTSIRRATAQGVIAAMYRGVFRIAGTPVTDAARLWPRFTSLATGPFSRIAPQLGSGAWTASRRTCRRRSTSRFPTRDASSRPATSTCTARSRSCSRKTTRRSGASPARTFRARWSTSRAASDPNNPRPDIERG